MRLHALCRIGLQQRQQLVAARRHLAESRGKVSGIEDHRHAIEAIGWHQAAAALEGVAERWLGRDRLGHGVDRRVGTSSQRWFQRLSRGSLPIEILDTEGRQGNGTATSVRD
jgi:hypothetical protein